MTAIAGVPAGSVGSPEVTLDAPPAPLTGLMIIAILLNASAPVVEAVTVERKRPIRVQSPLHDA